MENIKVLFLCVHNSARSQMAEAFLKAIGGERFEVESAGLEVGTLNPYAVQVMAEIGIDISKNRSKSVFEFIRTGRLFQYVITVCDEASAERCPIFPGFTRRLHWSFPDPALFTGTDEEKMMKTRSVRDQIRDRIARWLEELAVEDSSIQIRP
ncbi:MAG TPA: arsenate reductase ArsC [Candidatus Deferrimicrobium sp.]|nr:arsenate reductase ArsC [Candidatus Kapabacteria bacterium]HLP57878.1 arsenate reductase ArsC [Candidatus Deferrimicrobium sp.]